MSPQGHHDRRRGAHCSTSGSPRSRRALYQTKSKSSQDPLNYPIRLNNKLSNLTGVVASADAPPTAQTQAVYDDVAGKIDVELARARVLLSDDLGAFNRLVRESEIPAVVVKEKRPAGESPPKPSF